MGTGTRKSQHQGRGSMLPMILAIALCLLAGRADAALQTWAIYGDVLSTPGEDDPNLLNGSGFRMYFTIEDSTPDANPDPSQGDYSQNTFVVVEVRHPTTFAATTKTDAGAFAAYGLYNDIGSPPNVFDIHTMLFSVFLQFGAMTSPVNAIEFLLQSRLSSAPVPPLTSDALPSPPPPLADFNEMIDLTVQAGLLGDVMQIGVTHFGVLGGQSAPVLPTSRIVNPDGTITWTFASGATLNTVARCAGRCWIDPPLAPGYVYATDGNSRFTAIQDFPTGFNQEFEVHANGSSLGTFGPGESIDFTGFPGGGVVMFTVSGIDPSVDAADQFAFPLEISTDSSNATFTMTSFLAGGGPVDVPALAPLGTGLAIAAIAIAGSVLSGRRRRRS